MNFLFSMLSIGIIGGADGPTAVTVSGNLPLPAILVSVFAIAFILYVYIAKAIRGKKSPVAASAEVEAPAAKPTAVARPAGMTQGSLELVNTDEKTAAVIMAIVSDKSGIPLNRLAFKSIKLLEDK